MIITINATIRRDNPASETTEALGRMFGIDDQAAGSAEKAFKCAFELSRGDIVLVTGPSGSGKRTLMRLIAQRLGGHARLCVETIRLPKDRAAFDCVRGSVIARIKAFAQAGIADVGTLLASPQARSDGEKWRVRLAMALGERTHFVLSHDFCSHLDSITAGTVCARLRKRATQKGETFILASERTDFAADLDADVLIHTELAGQPGVHYRDVKRANRNARELRRPA